MRTRGVHTTLKPLFLSRGFMWYWTGRCFSKSKFPVPLIVFLDSELRSKCYCLSTSNGSFWRCIREPSLSIFEEAFSRYIFSSF